MPNVAYAYFKSKDEEQAFLMTGSNIGFTQWDNGPFPGEMHEECNVN